MDSTSNSASPSMISGGGRGKLDPCCRVSEYGVRRPAWKTLWIVHDGGKSNWYATGDIRFVILNGPCRFGASLAETYGRVRFFASNQTFVPSSNMKFGVCPAHLLIAALAISLASNALWVRSSTLAFIVVGPEWSSRG